MCNICRLIIIHILKTDLNEKKKHGISQEDNSREQRFTKSVFAQLLQASVVSSFFFKLNILYYQSIFYLHQRMYYIFA
jgi:hypothetical protein